MTLKYAEFFSEFPYKKTSSSLETEPPQTCNHLALTALSSAVRNQFVISRRILEDMRATCSGYESQLEVREAQLFIELEGKAMLRREKALRLIESFLVEFPNAGFARVLQAEILLQNRNHHEAKKVVKDTLNDFPEAKWLHIFLVQLEVFAKNYLEAASQAKLMPFGVLRSLNLFWTKFWYPRLFLNYLLSIIAVFFLSVLPTWLLFVGAIVLFCSAIFFLFSKKDRLTFLWFFYFSIAILLATVFS